MKLTKTEMLLLDALRASAHNEKVHWGGEQAETEDRIAFLKRLSEHSEVPVNEALFSSVTMEEWKALFKLSASHKVLPLVYNVVYDCPVFIEAFYIVHLIFHPVPAWKRAWA